MARAIRTAFLLFLLVSSPARGAEQVDLRFGGTTGWESDVPGTGSRSDVVWELRPGIALKGRHTRFDYSLGYHSRVEMVTQLQRDARVDHYLDSDVEYRIGPRTSLSLSESLSVASSLQRLNEAIQEEDVSGETLVEGRRDVGDILTNRFSATLSARLLRRVEGTLSLSHFLRQSQGDAVRGTLSGRDTSAVTLEGKLDYVLSEDSRFGGGFRWRRRESDRVGAGQVGDDAGTVTTLYDVFGSWTYRIDPRTTFSVRAGPSLGQDDREFGQLTVQRFPQVPGDPESLVEPRTCPAITVDGDLVPILSRSCQPFTVIPQPDLTDEQQATLAGLTQDVDVLAGARDTSSTTNVNLFATMSFTRTWDRWNLLLRYTRSDSLTQGLGSATVLDVVSSSVSWTPRRRWRVRSSFSFTRRTTELDQSSPVVVLENLPMPIPALGLHGAFGPPLPYFGAEARGIANLGSNRTFYVDTYAISTRVTRDLGRRTTVFAEARWRLNTGGGDLAADQFDRYVVRIGVSYRLRPIRL